jgi:aspartyl aminopeptidase
MERELKDLLSFIKAAPSPYHTVVAASQKLQEAGFEELDMAAVWQLEAGQGYFVPVYGSALLAFVVGKEAGQLRIAAAHTDFPCFRVKPRAGIKKEGYGLLNVEKYGGMMLRTWLDRPLSLAGKVVVRSGEVFSPEVRLVDFQRPLLTIPSLAIHMDRDVNDEGKLNPQTDMLPLATMSGEEISESFFLDWLANELSISPEDILSYELSAYPFEKGCFCGLQEEFISSPRLDNLTPTLACLKGIASAEPEDFSGLRLIALFDNEEVGSSTKQGAGSAVLNQVLERIYSALGRTREDLWADIASGFMLSVDVAHALHPNHADKCDPSHKPLMGSGVALKQAAAQTYAGDAEAIAIIRGLCEASDIPWQTFVNRNDIRGGSTLGSLASALVPIRTMDIGVPMLAMHSAREVMHKDDQLALNKLLITFMGF